MDQRRQRTNTSQCPYVYLRQGRYEVYVRALGHQVYVGTFVKWINAVIAFNAIMGRLNGGLLMLQRGLRKRKEVDVLTQAVKDVKEYEDWIKNFDENDSQIENAEESNRPSVQLEI